MNAADRLIETAPFETANRQVAFPKGLTVKQAAAAFNISERTVYLARELLTYNRPDLERHVMAGTLTIAAALKISNPNKYARKPSPLKALVTAWARCDASMKLAFLEAIGGPS